MSPSLTALHRVPLVGIDELTGEHLDFLRAVQLLEHQGTLRVLRSLRELFEEPASATWREGQAKLVARWSAPRRRGGTGGDGRSSFARALRDAPELASIAQRVEAWTAEHYLSARWVLDAALYTLGWWSTFEHLDQAPLEWAGCGEASTPASELALRGRGTMEAIFRAAWLEGLPPRTLPLQPDELRIIGARDGDVRVFAVAVAAPHLSPDPQEEARVLAAYRAWRHVWCTELAGRFREEPIEVTNFGLAFEWVVRHRVLGDSYASLERESRNEKARKRRPELEPVSLRTISSHAKRIDDRLFAGAPKAPTRRKPRCR